MSSLDSLKSLIGRRVELVEINGERDLVILHTPESKIYLTWEGDCCAQCFLAHVSGSENLRGAVISSVESAEWTTLDKNDDGCVESMGSTIKTDKGTVTFESRLEHNGYYGGEILISETAPLDQYDHPRYSDKEFNSLVLTPLEDF